MEEVSYRTDEGLMVTGAALFFADGDVAFADPIRVTLELPKGWRANTPWNAVDERDATFDVASRRELTSNALFLGTADASTLRGRAACNSRSCSASATCPRSRASNACCARSSQSYFEAVRRRAAFASAT